MGKRGQDSTTEQQQQPSKHEAPADDSKVSHGSLREAVNSGEYGIDYQRSDYEDAAKQSEADGHSPTGEGE